MKTYCIVYRTGGTENGQYHRSIPYDSEDEARKALAETRNMGYWAVLEDYNRSVAIGLPDD